VVVAPCLTIDKKAVQFARDVCFWPINDFRSWAKDALTVVRELRNKLSGVGDLEWRANAMSRYEVEGIAPTVLAKRLGQQLLMKLPLHSAYRRSSLRAWPSPRTITRSSKSRRMERKSLILGPRVSGGKAAVRAGCVDRWSSGWNLG
jgi:hypothetical protein